MENNNYQEELDNETEVLKQELEHFRAEKEKIRKLIGQIRGSSSAEREKLITIIFCISLIILFTLDICRHILGIHVPLPPLFSVEIGILLVSIKIIWMIQKQRKVEHFQFWILNSIEFRLNQIAKKLKQLENPSIKKESFPVYSESK